MVLIWFYRCWRLFSILVNKTEKRTLGWKTELKFQVGLHLRDIDLLLNLQQYLDNIGSIHKDFKQNRVIYSISSIKDLNKLILHFEKYPLLTQKAADLFLFNQALKLMNNKAHLTKEGLSQIINIKASMNLGLSNMLKSEFNEFIPVERPVINTENIPDPYWIAGFVSGEGNFSVHITKSTNKIGKRVQLRFKVTQHERDLKLLEVLIRYLGTGSIYKYPNQPAVCLTVVNFSDITNIIIPLFDKNTLVGVKLYDYFDWCKIHKLMLEGSHLTM